MLIRGLGAWDHATLIPWRISQHLSQQHFSSSPLIDKIIKNNFNAANQASNWTQCVHLFLLRNQRRPLWNEKRKVEGCIKYCACVPACVLCLYVQGEKRHGTMEKRGNAGHRVERWRGTWDTLSGAVVERLGTHLREKALPWIEYEVRWWRGRIGKRKEGYGQEHQLETMATTHQVLFDGFSGRHINGSLSLLTTNTLLTTIKEQFSENVESGWPLTSERMLTLAPASTNTSTMSNRPFSAAKCRGAQPHCNEIKN